MIPNYPSPLSPPPTTSCGWLPKPSHLSDARVAAFWSKVTITPGCWIWNASTTKSGYGQFWNGATMVRSHRLAYELVVGPIPTGLEPDHLCHDPQECHGLGADCPHRRCVNTRRISRSSRTRSTNTGGAYRPPTSTLNGHSCSAVVPLGRCREPHRS